MSYPIVARVPAYRQSSRLPDLEGVPITAEAPARRSTRRSSRGLGTITPRSSAQHVVSHYDIRPVLDIYATTQGRDLGARRPPTSSKVLKDLAKETSRRAPRSPCAARW